MADTAYRDSLRLAAPLILSNLCVPLLGIVDTAVAGHLPGAHNLAAVALGAATMNVVVFGFGFLRMGTTGLTAQAFGARDGDEVRALLARALVLAAGFAAVLLPLGPVILAAVRALFVPDARVEPVLETYLAVRLLGLPGILGTTSVLGWLLGLQDARGPLAIFAVISLVNGFLDVLFVFGFGWGVEGAAVAAVVGEYAGFAVGLAFVRRRLRLLPGAWSRARALDRVGLTRLFAVNRDIFLRTLCLEAAFVGLTAVGARQGEVVLAANAILLNFQTLTAFVLDGFAHAAEALVGRHVGSRDPRAFRAAVRAGIVWSAGLAALLSLAFALFGARVIDLMTDLDAVRAAAGLCLPYLVLSPIVSVWAFLLDGVFIGATRTGAMRDAMLACLAVFGLAAFLLVPPYGNAGLWAAFLIFMAARGAGLGLAYLVIQRRGGFTTPAVGAL